jgi:hypothetical protein
MSSVKYIILSACQSEGLYTQFGFESEAAAWLEKQGTNPCAYVYYRQGVGVAGFDNVSVAFGGSNPSAALLRVRDSLERSLEFRSDRQTEVGGFPVLAVTARAKRRIYGFGGGVRPVPPVPPTPTVDYMYFEAQEANSTVSLMSMLETAPDLEYSTDGVTWQEWQHTTAEGTHTFDTLTLTAIGDRVYLRGDNPNGLATLPEGAEAPLFSHFEMTGKIAAGGNIMSLLDKDTEITEIPAYGFAFLFGIFGEAGEASLNTSLTAAAAMPNVTTIGEGGCGYMYSGCTSLTAAAAMPNVTTIGDNGCAYMYQDCTSLTAAATMPNVTTIGNVGCDQMYKNCTFDMSDDGTTLNFDFPTPPITAGGTTYSTAYDVALWMGNTNGFTNP